MHAKVPKKHDIEMLNPLNRSMHLSRLGNPRRSYVSNKISVDDASVSAAIDNMTY